MKKLFIICIGVFFLSGIGLFFVFDKNYDTIKNKINKRFDSSNGTDIVTFGKALNDLTTVEKDFTGNYEGIDITLSVGDLRIEPYDGKTIHIKAVVPKEKVDKYQISDNGLEIKIESSIVQDLYIQIPKDMYLKATIKQGLGDCTIEGLKDIDVKLNTGDLTATNILGVKNARLDIGDLKLLKVSNIEYVKLSTGSAKIDLIEQNKDFQIENNLGDVELVIPNGFLGQISTDVKLGESEQESLSLKGGTLKGNIKLDLGSLKIRGKN